MRQTRATLDTIVTLVVKDSCA